MFFQNLEQMKRQCEMLLQMDESMIESLLNNGHDWADDHISEAKNNMDQVFDFIMNEKDDTHGDEMIIDDVMENKKTILSLDLQHSDYQLIPNYFLFL